jgi:predicted transcriptional regulator
MDESTWIADGTAEAEPVTTETPVEVAEVIEAPAEVVEPVAVEAPETPAEVAQAFIEARLGEDVFQIPEGVKLPLKRGKDVDYRDLKEVLADGMRLNDYSRNMNELRDQRSAFERQQAEAERAVRKNAEKEKYLSERENEIKQALSDPESAQKYEQHLQQLRDNPMYRKVWEENWANRETKAELETLQEQRDQQIVQEASTRVRSWIEDLASDFPGVEPGRVAQIYGQRLSSGQASLDLSHVREIYRSEADYLSKATSPLQDQLAELAAKIDSLSETKAAERHNETTAHALNRAKTPRVATSSGAPATTPKPVTKFGPNELQERNSEWVAAGRS